MAKSEVKFNQLGNIRRLAVLKTVWQEEDQLALKSKRAGRALWAQPFHSDVDALICFICRAQLSASKYESLDDARAEFDYQLSQFVRRYVEKNLS